MKQKFNIITSTCIPLPLENVDTDQIIRTSVAVPAVNTLRGLLPDMVFGW